MKRPRPARGSARRRGPGVELLEGRLLLASINEFGAASGVNQPSSITAGPDGALWFGEASGRVGRITTGGAITEFTAGITPGANITSIAAGSDGNLWFTENNTSRIGRITPDGVVTEFIVPPNDSIIRAPLRITPGSDGNLWFTDSNADSIGRITTAGDVTEFDVLSINASPTGIVSGPDGNLWFLQSGLDSVGVITTAGILVAEYPVGTANNLGLDSITNGPGGTLWFTEAAAGAVGQITTAGAVTEFSTGNPAGRPIGIAFAPDGFLYFAESQGDSIGQISATGAVNRFPVPTTGVLPYAVTVGPDLNLWFTEYGGTQIGQLVLPTSITPAGQTLTAGAGQAGTFAFATFTQLSAATVAGNYRATLDFGEGTGTPGTVVQTAPGVFEVRAARTFAAPGTYTVTVVVGTDAGNAAPVQATITVATSIAITPDAPAGTAGVPLAATFATFTDAGPDASAASYTATIDFGDGTTGPGTVSVSGPGRFAVQATHTYTAPGSYAATVRVASAAGDFASATVPVSITSGLAANASNLFAYLDEPLNTVFGTFTDPANLAASAYAATVDFGDGTAGPGTVVQTGASQYAVLATHTYAAAGQRPFTVTVTSAFQGAAQATGSVLVAPALAASGTRIDAGLGQPLTATFATFSDLNTDRGPGSYQATIDFGDGTSGPGTVVLDTPGQFRVVADHTYNVQGTLAATIRIVNASGGTAAATSTVVVSIGPILSATPFATAVNTAQQATYATFQDFTGDRNAGAYQATVDFGDGTSGLGTVVATGGLNYAVVAAHAYAAGGVYAAVVRVSVGNVVRSTTTAVTVIDPLDTVVVNTNDNGRGSLRQAILNSNSIPGANTITFAIPGGGVKTVRPQTPLPDLTDQVTIDGTSQAAFAGVATATPLVEVDGRSIGGATAGLRLAAGASSSSVLDLSVFGFRGAQLEDLSSRSFLYGNYLGIRADGTIPALDTGRDDASTSGLRLAGDFTRVGGTATGLRNVIGGNPGAGVEITGSFALLLNNLIGVDPTGTEARGNRLSGVVVRARASFTNIADGNIISANGGDGIEALGTSGININGAFIGTDITGTRALGNAGSGVVFVGARLGIVGSNTFQLQSDSPTLISGNGSVGVAIRGGSTVINVLGSLIGTDITGTKALGNGSTGVLISDSPGNFVFGNLISGNGSGRAGAGVWVEGAASSGNRVQANFIGTDFAGTGRLGNAVIGVLIVDAPNNLVGGTSNQGFPDRNVISGNGQVGVMISGPGATGNAVQGNLIGTDATGTAAVPNGQILDGTIVGAGVYLNGAPGNLIGGAAAEARNVISGNRADGVFVFDAGAAGNAIQGNFIGTDITGTRPLGNGRDGVAILDARRTRVDRNLIAANRRNGVAIGGFGSVGNVLAANVIGPGPSGSALSNGSWGILVTQNARARRNAFLPSNQVGPNGLGAASGTGRSVGFARPRPRVAAAAKARTVAGAAHPGPPRRPS